jgi:hypothetical protein
MLEDLKQRFAVDDSVIYLAGFSGGSRVAGSIALTEGTIAGVIGCGQDFPILIKDPSGNSVIWLSPGPKISTIPNSGNSTMCSNRQVSPIICLNSTAPMPGLLIL